MVNWDSLAHRKRLFEYALKYLAFILIGKHLKLVEYSRSDLMLLISFVLAKLAGVVARRALGGILVAVVGGIGSLVHLNSKLYSK